LAEWLYEEGIGENRAILVEDGQILEAAIELPGELRAGAIVAGRLTEILIPGRRGLVAGKPDWFVVEPLPSHLTKGQAVNVEVAREPILEPGNHKYAKGRITDEAVRDGPSLAERIGEATVLRATDADRFEQAGWSELLEDAISGEIFFSGGNLRMSLTPAMTLFDVDGSLPPAELAEAGAAAAALTIRQMGITGSIGIDLPTVVGKAERQRAALAFDAVLPRPFERTTVNGFGFLQIVRKRERQSLPERMQLDPVPSAGRSLLRRAERVPGIGAREITASPQVVRWLEQEPRLIEELARRIGTAIRLKANPAFTTWGGHVQTVQN
jgi:hypothetical protein